MEKNRRSTAHRVLPSDLTSEVLLRLPAKSLWRFRCVCKSWLALFSDPIFGKRHRARSLPNPSLLTCASVPDGGDGEDYHVTLHVSLFDSEGTLVSQFTRRCLCSHPILLSICGDLVLTTSFVCNHATQEVMPFPPSYMGFALGHVASTNEFKVLALESRTRYKILTLGTHQWRDVDYPPCGFIGFGAFANGAIYVPGVDNNEIASFNLEREEWRVTRFEIPPLTRPNCDLFNLREFSGYPCFVDVVDTDNSVDIWLLKDYDKGLWVKQYTVCLSTLKAKRYWASVNPLLIEDDGRLLVQVDEYSLQLYDPKTQCSREIQHFEKMEDARSFFIKCFSSLGHRACV